MSAFFIVRARVERPGSVGALCVLFEDLAKARAVPGSEAIKPLIAEFDRLWGKKVLRTREVVRVVQRAGA